MPDYRRWRSKLGEIMANLSKGAVLGASLLVLNLAVAGCAPNKIQSNAVIRNEPIAGLLVINTAFGQPDFATGLKGELAKCGVGMTAIANADVHGKDKAAVTDLLKRRGGVAGAGHLLEIYWSSSHRTVGSSARSSHYTLALTRMADGQTVWTATDSLYFGLLRETPNYGAVAADIVARIKADGVLACG